MISIFAEWNQNQGVDVLGALDRFMPWGEVFKEWQQRFAWKSSNESFQVFAPGVPWQRTKFSHWDRSSLQSKYAKTDCLLINLKNESGIAEYHVWVGVFPRSKDSSPVMCVQFLGGHDLETSGVEAATSEELFGTCLDLVSSNEFTALSVSVSPDSVHGFDRIKGTSLDVAGRADSYHWILFLNPGEVTALGGFDQVRLNAPVADVLPVQQKAGIGALCRSAESPDSVPVSQWRKWKEFLLEILPPPVFRGFPDTVKAGWILPEDFAVMTVQP